uniref:hypothetical protein n=1 Tax=uncultured Planktosalinus sp. TaxID=1810935 RepID=UPI0030DAE529
HTFHTIAQKMASRQMIRKIETVVEMMREKNLELGFYDGDDYRDPNLAQIENIDFNFREYPKSNALF